MKYIYLLLTGGLEPRINALLKNIQKIPNPNWDDIKIIVTGKSGWRYYVDKTSADEMKEHLIKKNIPEKCIILEEEALDTLGNMVFTHEIIEGLLSQYSLNNITLTLVTEGFHMKRSKYLFEKVFNDLIFSHNNLSIKYVSGRTLGISKFYWKRKAIKILKELKSTMYKFNPRDLTKDTTQYINKFFNLDSKYIHDYIIYNFLIHDLDRFQKFQEIKDYMFSIPIYNTHYIPKHIYPPGAYATLIVYMQISKGEL